MRNGHKNNRDNDPNFLRLQASILMIKAHRIEHGPSQTRVAELMGTTQSAVSDLESLSVEPQVITFMRYAKACGASVQMSVTFPKDEDV